MGEYFWMDEPFGEIGPNRDPMRPYWKPFHMERSSDPTSWRRSLPVSGPASGPAIAPGS